MRMSRRRSSIVGGALVTLVVLVLGCGRAIDRPLSGAAPGTRPAEPVGAPPTLSPSEALRFKPLPSPPPAAPGAAPAASPAASPSAAPAPPIVRTIAPAQGGTSAPGAVTVSAVLVGRTADLADASLAVNGADTGAQIDKRTLRDWTIHTSRPLAAGTYTARVLVRDTSGTTGGFTWQFTVAEPQAAPPAEPAASAVPTRKPSTP